MSTIIAFVCGLLMSVGLIISGMVNPQKVIGFLDVFGKFDVTLVFVMAGALLVAGLGFRFVGCGKPLLCDCFHASKKNKVDGPLLIGAAVFGIGWGLAGFCPGPAIVGVGLRVPQTFVFVSAMLLGMFCARRILK